MHSFRNGARRERMIPQSLSGIVPNREHWLTTVAVLLRPWFAQRGLEIPLRVRLGVGALGENRRTLGACYCTADEAGYRHITISPFVDDPLVVGATLVHELIHASLSPDEGHGPRFREAAQKIGLEGRVTEANPGLALTGVLRDITRKAGPYPHKAISR